MIYASKVLAGGGLIFLFLGTLSGWWLAVNMKNNEGKGERYVWATHKAALWFGFMNMGLSYVIGHMSLPEIVLNYTAWALNTGLLFVIVSQILLALKHNPNLWTTPAPVAVFINVAGDIVIMIAIGIFCYGGIISFFMS